MSTPLVNAPEKPRPPAYLRWLVLVVASLAMFGNYYVYDAVSPLADVLKEQLQFTDANIGWLNAIYSFPNIIMVLIGGIIIDLIGTRRGSMLFGTLCLIGAAITASSSELWVMATGRLVFGIGAESLIVAVTTALAKWFKGKELGFAFGLNLTIARIGSFAALNSPTWAKPAYEHWQTPLLISVAFGVFCVVGAVIYSLVEGGALKKYSLGTAETDKFRFKDIFGFSASYWLVTGLCFAFYAAIFPFQTFAVKFFIERHGTTRELGGFLSSMLTLFSMICTPLFGLLADKIGKRALMMIFGTAMLIPTYLVMAYTSYSVSLFGMNVNLSLFIPMAMMGISFSLVPAVMWPSVTYLVSPKILGTAFGLMTMIQNIGFFGLNLSIGMMNDGFGASAENPGGYAPGMWLFATMVFVGFIFALLLRFVEKGSRGHGLDLAQPKGVQ